MFREFTACSSHDWISILPKLLNEHNNSKHRTIGMTPVQADLYPSSVTIKQLGENVRISTQKGVFTKGNLPYWSTEIFEIIKINKTLPVTYQLQDYTGKPIAGCFYSVEIHKTDHPNEYLIEKNYT
ncbi:putative transposon-derived protein F54H12.3 [Aphis craccivora]|uniref:Putative transposon-derived protein F54H12.3 n=1 Tax=Aphis craccivora TaxID=307492 RepID=A0A6G0YA97_APHCR|nr:putative transposon-derived protein F54H12.3 [Aphis craccivora]